MIDLNSNFEAVNKRGGKPVITADIVETDNSLEESTQADWTANTGESNVDYATIVGDVQLDVDSTPVTIVNQTTGGSDLTFTIGDWNYAQSFKHSDTYTRTIQDVILYMKLSIAGAVFVNVKIYDSTLTTILATSEASLINSTSYSAETMTFSTSVDLEPNTQYWIVPTFPFGFGGVTVLADYTTTDAYTDGYLRSNVSDGSIGDFKMTVKLDDGYTLTSGHIYTDEMDFGSTPTINGEWEFNDTTPNVSDITFEAWASDTGAFAGEETSLGTVVDGDPITVLEQYYRVKATFIPDSTGLQSPRLHSILAKFQELIKISDQPVDDYTIDLLSVSGVNAKIDTFKLSAMGGYTLTTNLTEKISTWIDTKFPLNKEITVRMGWSEIDFADYITLFKGKVENVTIANNRTTQISIKDSQVDWKTKTPEKWESAGDDVTYTAQHPIDVILDLFTTYTTVRDSLLDDDSFQVVKNATIGWQVTRTITDSVEETDKLINELRILLSAFFIFTGDGKIKIKQYDSTEASELPITDDMLIGFSWDGNFREIINKTNIYFGWDGAGNEFSDFANLTVTVNADSVTNYNRTKIKEIKDKWTASAQASQITTLSNNIVGRFKDPPPEVSFELDREFFWLEVADVVDITTNKAPSTDLTGITNEKFQITEKQFNPKSSKVKFKALKL
jgi:hypothetical protein